MSDYSIDYKKDLSVKNNILPTINDHPSTDNLPSTNIKFSDIKSRIYRDLYNNNDQINSNNNDSFSLTSVVNTNNLSVMIQVTNETNNTVNDDNGVILIKPIGGSGKYQVTYAKVSGLDSSYKWTLTRKNGQEGLLPIARWANPNINTQKANGIASVWGLGPRCTLVKGVTNLQYQSKIYYITIKNTSTFDWNDGFYYRISNLGVTDTMAGGLGDTGLRDKYSEEYSSYSAGPFGAFIYGVSTIDNKLATPSEGCNGAEKWAPAKSGVLKNATGKYIWEIANWVYGYGGRDDNYNDSNPYVPQVGFQSLVDGLGDPGSDGITTSAPEYRGNRVYINKSGPGASRGGTIYFRSALKKNTQVSFYLTLNHPCTLAGDDDNPIKCYNDTSYVPGPGWSYWLPEVNKWTPIESAGPIVYVPETQRLSAVYQSSTGFYKISNLSGNSNSNNNEFPVYCWVTDEITGQEFKFVVRVGKGDSGAWAGLTTQDYVLPTEKRIFDSQTFAENIFSKKITFTYPGKDGVYTGYYIDDDESGGKIYY